VATDGTMWYVGAPQSDKPHASISKPYWNVDLKLYKKWYLGNITYRLFMEVENVFNHKIPRLINPYTGKPYNPGEIIGYNYVDSPNPNFNPARFRWPRTILTGISLKF
jgi:hypothetical protein